ncbi:MAG TPA: hypothetical protein VES42_09525 [Pilimelia sp.]|nr:hypothetical protein [Pilimelia sp.]
MIAFETSGTTGPPVAWWRTAAQLDAEARLLHTLLGRVDRVVNFAPPRHLYGRIFGVELPRLLGVPAVPAWDDPMTLPRLRAKGRHLLVCLPSTWPLLRWHLARLRDHDVVAVHSTARTTGAAYEVVERLRMPALEVLGSTETGAVATRAIGREVRDWTLLPDVTRLDDDEGRLHVRGPRLAHSLATYRLADLVEVTGDRTFRHIGRATALVKVNGRRCDLDGVAALVRRIVPGSQARCVPVRDPLRGEHYDLYYTAGPEPAELRRLLAAAHADVPAPRTVHRAAR